MWTFQAMLLIIGLFKVRVQTESRKTLRGSPSLFEHRFMNPMDEVFSFEFDSSNFPSSQPSAIPVGLSIVSPTLMLTELPTSIPSVTPTETPTLSPMVTPSQSPTAMPTVSPFVSPTAKPSAAINNPTMNPSVDNTNSPTYSPSLTETTAPTAILTDSPTTVVDTLAPSQTPSEMPTTYSLSAVPSTSPTPAPSETPTVWPVKHQPSSQPTISIAEPSGNPTFNPTSMVPTVSPSGAPTTGPTVDPNAVPTAGPSAAPSAKPTLSPVSKPTTRNPTIIVQTGLPSQRPSALPKVTPSQRPTTAVPSGKPSHIPTVPPTVRTSPAPSVVVFREPTVSPSTVQTIAPTASPTLRPTSNPTAKPTVKPTAIPTVETQTKEPTVPPSRQPSAVIQTNKPFVMSTSTPKPVVVPTQTPARAPTAIATLEPSASPVVLTVRPSTSSPTQRPSATSANPTLHPTHTPSLPPTAAPVHTLTPTAVVPAYYLTFNVLYSVFGASSGSSDGRELVAQGLSNTTLVLLEAVPDDTVFTASAAMIVGTRRLQLSASETLYSVAVRATSLQPDVTYSDAVIVYRTAAKIISDAVSNGTATEVLRGVLWHSSSGSESDVAVQSVGFSALITNYPAVEVVNDDDRVDGSGGSSGLSEQTKLVIIYVCASVGGVILLVLVCICASRRCEVCTVYEVRSKRAVSDGAPHNNAPVVTDAATVNTVDLQLNSVCHESPQRMVRFAHATVVSREGVCSVYGGTGSEGVGVNDGESKHSEPSAPPLDNDTDTQDGGSDAPECTASWWTNWHLNRQLRQVETEKRIIAFQEQAKKISSDSSPVWKLRWTD